MLWFGQFVPRLSDLTIPLFKLINHSCTDQWSAEHDQGFQRLKAAFTSHTVLGYLSFDDPTVSFNFCYAIDATIAQTDGPKT